MPTETESNEARIIEIEDELDVLKDNQVLADIAFKKALRKAQREGWSADFQTKKQEYITGVNERSKRYTALLAEFDRLTA